LSPESTHRAVRSLALLVAVGCGASTNTQHPANPAPTLSVLQAGAEPRQRLRYELPLHAPERMELSLKVRVTNAFTNTVLETGRRSVDLPTVRIDGRVAVTKITPSGEALVTYELENAVVLDDLVDPAVRRPLEAAMAAMKGWRGSWRMSPSGLLSDIVFDTPNASKSGRNSLSNVDELIPDMSVVFPDAEIGVGATWEVKSRRSMSGVTWERTATYRLRELGASSATVDANVVMHASSQALTVEPNASTRLTSGTVTGSANLSVPLRGLVPTGMSQATSEMNFSIIRGRQRIITSLETQTFVSVKPIGTEAAVSEPSPP